MSKVKRNSIYIKAIVFLIFYLVVSHTIFVHALSDVNIVTSYLFPALFGIAAATIFLFIFSHEDFFKFAKEIEKKEKKVEDKWLHIFAHTSKTLTTLLVGILAGPIFLALTARLLLHNTRYKYLLVPVAAIISAFLYVSLGRGVFGFIF